MEDRQPSAALASRSVPREGSEELAQSERPNQAREVTVWEDQSAAPASPARRIAVRQAGMGARRHGDRGDSGAPAARIIIWVRTAGIPAAVAAVEEPGAIMEAPVGLLEWIMFSRNGIGYYHPVRVPRVAAVRR